MQIWIYVDEKFRGMGVGNMCDRLLTREAKNHQTKRQDVLDRVAQTFFESHSEDNA